jgi:hypothetical protein
MLGELKTLSDIIENVHLFYSLLAKTWHSIGIIDRTPIKILIGVMNWQQSGH